LATDDSQPQCRVVYVGSSRKLKSKFAFIPTYVDERSWRQELATEMEEVCQDMQQKGLHLTHVVPVSSSRDLAGGWTEGAWLYFSPS